MRWEYLTWSLIEEGGLGSITYVNGELREVGPSLTEALSQAGSDGWELVSTHAVEDWVTYVFKRPKWEG